MAKTEPLTKDELVELMTDEIGGADQAKKRKAAVTDFDVSELLKLQRKRGLTGLRPVDEEAV